MSEPSNRLLAFSSVAAGGNSYWHIYYGRYYVGRILRSRIGWGVWHLEMLLGDFAELEEAKRAVAEWYYGPYAD
jgi:hypothetical protein